MRHAWTTAAGCGLALVLAGSAAGAAPAGIGRATSTAPAPAPAAYPFEGTWIRADRPCNAKATLVRTYTAHDVVSSRSHCAIRRVEGSGAGPFELLEDCRRNPPPRVTETIRMLAPDQFTLKRQVVRLKIPRPVRFARCTAAAPEQAHAPR